MRGWGGARAAHARELAPADDAARARKAALRVLKAMAMAAGIAVVLTVIVAIRVYAYLPAVH